MEFSEGLAGVKLRGLYGFIDSDCNLKIEVVIDFISSDIIEISTSMNHTIATITDNYKKGIMDLDTGFNIPPNL